MYKTNGAAQAQTSDESVRTWYEKVKQSLPLSSALLLSSCFGFSFPLPLWHGLCLPFAKQAVALRTIFSFHKVPSGWWCKRVASPKRADGWSIPGGMVLVRELCVVAACALLRSGAALGWRLRFTDSCCVPPSSPRSCGREPHGLRWKSLLSCWIISSLSMFKAKLAGKGTAVKQKLCYSNVLS